MYNNEANNGVMAKLAVMCQMSAIVVMRIYQPLLNTNISANDNINMTMTLK